MGLKEGGLGRVGNEESRADEKGERSEEGLPRSLAEGTNGAAGSHGMDPFMLVG